MGLSASIGGRAKPATSAGGLIAAVVAVCVGMPLAIAAVTGNLAIPHNDSWALSRITETFARTGEIRLLNWNDMNLIGQVVVLGPLGTSIVAQQVAVSVFSAVAIVCVHRLVRPSLGRGAAILATLIFALWPGWASLSVSFMTDVPAFAGTFLALVLGRRALRRDSLGWLVAAMLVSLWAVSVREQAVAAPAAIMLLGWHGRRERTQVGAAALAAAGSCLVLVIVAFELWRAGLPLGQNPVVAVGVADLLRGLVASACTIYFTTAVVLAPAVLLRSRPRGWDRRRSIAAAAGALCALVAGRHGWVAGNYLQRSGEYSQLVFGHRAVLGAPVWDLIIVMGAASSVLLAPALVGRSWTAEPLLGLFTGLVFAGSCVVGATQHGVFDRYLPALVPGVLVALLSSARPAPSASRSGGGHRRPESRLPAQPVSRGLAAAALAVVGLVSAALNVNANAFDIARWHMAERLTAGGLPAERVDGGLEWLGWHAPGGALYLDTRDRVGMGAAAIFSRMPSCVVLAASPLGRRGTLTARWTLTATARYRTFLVAGHSELYAYATHARGCRDHR